MDTTSIVVITRATANKLNSTFCMPAAAEVDDDEWAAAALDEVVLLISIEFLCCCCCWIRCSCVTSILALLLARS